MVFEERNNYSVHTCTGNCQHNCGFRVETTLPEEQLDASTPDISSNSTALGNKRRRSLCGSKHSPSKKLRVLAPRPGQSCHRRIHNSLESISLPVPQPTMEPDNTMLAKNYPGTVTFGDDGDPVLEDSNLVSCLTDIECSTTSSPPPSHIDHTTFTSSNMANDGKSQLETRRVEILSTQYQHTALNPDAQQLLTQHTVQDSSTNRSYRRGQILFLKWASDNNISDNNFSPIDLINFLSAMKSTHNYAVTTLQLFRSAPSYWELHVFFARQTYNVFRLIPFRCLLISPSCVLSSLSQRKTPDRRIIKSFKVRAHTDSTTLCPLQTFLVYAQRRPVCSSLSLFVNSISPDRPLQASTIQGWISRLLRRSTSEPRVSLRSIASSLALASGIPKDDVVTMGNWSNSSTFENHYRREHLSQFDFTSTLITLD
ncbi:uncharacterized protein BX663DRAFT_546695 [Cokeromyces recurvatus]|uniref:uncharacterized protein n=1 Tax=Cokeromyces recurvatus TaxID=90255 RepID=UPI00221F25BA|nr:uncharacterized protein BX663DRAFT_546695 [Cokeromyces recurvatus]KAI7898081.1 hypothetical protein BX663DRAFT_546695 [Cokeromyces recurvatus]